MSAAARRAAARALLLAVCAFASLYALLCHVPFTWANFIGAGLYPVWVKWALKLYPPALAAAGLAGAWALEGKRRRGYAAAMLAAAAAAAAAGWPARIEHGLASLVYAFAAWLPLLAWEALAPSPPPASAIEPDAALGPRVSAAALTAVFCALTGAAGYAADGGRPSPVALGWSLLTHGALFVAAALAADALSRLARPAALRQAAVWAVSVYVLARWALASFSFIGPAAWAYAALTAALLLRAARACALELAPGPRARALLLAALALAPLAARRTLREADWNGLLADLSALALWAAAAVLLPKPPAYAPTAGRSRAAALILMGALWAGDAAGSARLETQVRALAAEEPSLRAARRLLLARPGGDVEFFAYLAENTNLPRGTVRPRALAPQTEAATLLSERPHVFIIVIDSLRPDYLGAYAPRVRFTPSFDAFAREADVFPHAFTQYGATGLSTPSLWAGARLPHEQYPVPFSPFNTLEALVDRMDYRPLITLDTILSHILASDKAATALDRATTGNFKLCATLAELEGRLDEGARADKPLFVYTQPQDVHISVLQREARRPPNDARFEGFHAPYAARVAAMDACFGRFIAALKTKGLYERSLVILTADHGDSLGEGGRWGHAYTLYPEIVRVPLIIRLPPALRRRLSPDLETAAFLTDITPTLHVALEQRPPPAEEPFGRPLYAQRPEELARTRRPERLLVSSYGPVYGVLRGADTLYVADGVRYETLYFDLRRSGASGTPTREQDEAGRAAIRRHVDALRAFYGY